MSGPGGALNACSAVTPGVTAGHRLVLPRDVHGPAKRPRRCTASNFPRPIGLKSSLPAPARKAGRGSGERLISDRIRWRGQRNTRPAGDLSLGVGPTAATGPMLPPGPLSDCVPVPAVPPSPGAGLFMEAGAPWSQATCATAPFVGYHGIDVGSAPSRRTPAPYCRRRCRAGPDYRQLTSHTL
jgi:hypothetical protein